MLRKQRSKKKLQNKKSIKRGNTRKEVRREKEEGKRGREWLDGVRLRHVAVLIAAFAAGFIGIFTRLIGEGTPSLSIAFFRSFIGFIFLLALVPVIDHNFFKFSFKDVKSYIALGFFFALVTGLYISAFAYAPISNVVLIDAAYVIFTTLLAHQFLKERITRKEVEAMILGFAGLVIINPLQPKYAVGSLLALAAGLAFACYLTYLRYQEKNHTVGTSLWILLFSSIFLLPFVLMEGVGNIQQSWFWIILLGVLCTGLTTVLLTYGLAKVKAEDASILLMIGGPLTAIILSVLLLGESLEPRVLIGGACLLLAGVLIEYRRKRKRIRQGKRLHPVHHK